MKPDLGIYHGITNTTTCKNRSNKIIGSLIKWSICRCISHFWLWGTSSFDSSLKTTQEMMPSTECPKIADLSKIFDISHRTSIFVDISHWTSPVAYVNKSAILGHSLESIFSEVFLTEESNELVPQSTKLTVFEIITIIVILPH